MGNTSWKCYCGKVVTGLRAATDHKSWHVARGERVPGTKPQKASNYKQEETK